LIGDATKAKKKLNWEPQYDLDGLIKEMIASDVDLFKRDIHLRKAGHKTLRQEE
jgi:GDPmannose 4,6-dehydratase